MKTTLTILLLITSFTKSFSQNYHPLLEQNKYWIEFNSPNPIDHPECQMAQYCGGYRYYISDDTLINNMIYKIVKYNSIYTLTQPLFLFEPPYGVSTTSEKCCLLREDTVNKRVYYLDMYNYLSEQLIYNFNMKEGDTLNNEYPPNYILDSIRDYLLLNGETRKIYYFSGGYCPQDFYIEGIGGFNGFIYPFGGCFEGYSNLMCVHNSTSSLYSFNNTCDDITNITNKENIDKFEFKIYPNPTSNEIIIDRSNEIIKNDSESRLQIINILGQVVHTQEILNNFDRIDISNFQNGIYFINVNNETKKIIINKK